MIFTPTPVTGAFVIELEPREDSRGSFSRAFCLREFAEHGIAFSVAQANLAKTHRAGGVRGLHYQVEPALEQKLVRCISGAVFDAIVDMRPDSPTFRTAFWVRLDSTQRRSLFIPSGVAHGYQTLSDNAEFMYMTDQFYSPSAERGVRFDDPANAIPWPLAAIDIADRDRNWPLLPPR